MPDTARDFTFFKHWLNHSDLSLLYNKALPQTDTNTQVKVGYGEA